MIRHIKPKTCDICPAVEKAAKSTIKCGCMRSLTAGIDNNEEKINMYKNCPLGWK